MRHEPEGEVFMIERGVNIDHVATLREARKGAAPDVVEAARVCEAAGAHQITVHLRQDRRHIQDRDIEALAQTLNTRMNFEMGATDEIIAIAHHIKPYTVCLVPEHRKEVTTEGGLDVAGQLSRMTEVTIGMHEQGIRVSMFIDPEESQVEASKAVGADSVELHTGAYANARGAEQEAELERLRIAGVYAQKLGLALHAGHGLTRLNLAPIVGIPGLREVNIGHDIVARAVFIGLENAVKEILAALE